MTHKEVIEKLNKLQFKDIIEQFIETVKKEHLEGIRVEDLFMESTHEAEKIHFIRVVADETLAAATVARADKEATVNLNTIVAMSMAVGFEMGYLYKANEV